MTKDEEVSRWRRWVESNVPPEKFHRITEYFNRAADETNWGIVNMQQGWLEGKYGAAHREEPASPQEQAHIKQEQAHVKTALPHVYAEDRDRRDEIWSMKAAAKQHYIKKGFRGTDLHAKVGGIPIPGELARMPQITPLPENGQRIDKTSGLVLVKSRNVKVPYSSKVYMNDRILYKDSSGKVLAWQGGYVLMKKQNVMMPYATKTRTEKRATYWDFEGKMITWRPRPPKPPTHI